MLVLVLLFFSVSAAYIWLRYHYSYFERHNLPYLPATPLLGSLKRLLILRISFGEFFQSIYDDDHVKDAKISGFFLFHTPALMIRDPEIILLVLIKQFSSFLNRYESADPHYDQMGALTLPLAKYDNWRDSRISMAELFTSGCMKNRMYPLMLQVTAELEDYVKQHLGKVGQSNLELKNMCTLYTTDLTAKLFYSLDAGSLRHGDSVLRQQTRQLLKPDLRKLLHFMNVFFLPRFTHLLRAKVFSHSYTQFIRHLVDNQVRLRRGTHTSNGDLIDQLLRLQREKPSTHYAQHPDFIASQAGIILLAGFETSSALLGFTLYELAKQPQLQLRLRKELSEAFKKEQATTLCYEQLNSLPYLKMVALEALRLYPAAAFINRECTSDGIGFPFQPHANFVVPSGMPTYISILGLQRDAKYWPQPLYFDPERFSPEHLGDILPMTYIPFGAGPHGCIGSRLGILQLKLGLAHILRLCRVEICERTVDKIRFNPKTFMLESQDDLYLRFTRDDI